MMKWLFAFAALSVTALPAVAEGFLGRASVIDGDTLEIRGVRIRLWGIDAPESDQLCRGEDRVQYRCGAKAANELDAFIADRPVSCVPVDQDRYGRTVATCSVGCVKSRESATIPPFPDGGYGWDVSLKARIDPS
jgi:endonuclease YncB( thermonuclease family)